MSARIALVTGAAHGIGAAIAARLALEGCSVLVADINQAAAAQTAKAINAEPLLLDVSSEPAWDAAIAAVLARHNRLDVLVNNAGFGAPAPIVETSFASWRAQMAVNLDGVFLGVRAGLRVMLAQGSGVIVNIASLASYLGTPGNAAYCAAKAGVHLLTKTAAKEAAARGRQSRRQQLGNQPALRLRRRQRHDPDGRAWNAAGYR
jgi:NAD(P)-dependent dehydrogenase (short-subunit alcohol dehydrogenase family)